MNGWLWAATALLVVLLPCVLVAARSTYAGALAAVQLGGAATALALILMTVGYDRSVYANLALVLAVVNWIGCLVYARFLARM